jgi:hypothetical protein
MHLQDQQKQLQRLFWEQNMYTQSNMLCFLSQNVTHKATYTLRRLLFQPSFSEAIPATKVMITAVGKLTLSEDNSTVEVEMFSIENP